jgi:pyridoxine 4-dehydrogenase
MTPPTTLTLGDLTVNRMGFGAMRITGKGIWGPPADRDECLRVLRRAVDLGVNFIDTADSYGPFVSEELIAEALHPYPPGLVIATKGGFERSGPDRWKVNCDPKRLRECLDGSLRRLRVERIDLWQLHRIDRKVPEDEQLGVLAEFVREGKVRHVGLSEVTAEQLERARRAVPIVSVQNRYNLMDREWEPVLDTCERHGIAFIPWYPLGAGSMDGKQESAQQRLAHVAKRLGASELQVALAWLLARSPVMLPIPGTSKVPHLEENVRAAELQLTEADVRELAGDG